MLSMASCSNNAVNHANVLPSARLQGHPTLKRGVSTKVAADAVAIAKPRKIGWEVLLPKRYMISPGEGEVPWMFLEERRTPDEMSVCASDDGEEDTVPIVSEVSTDTEGEASTSLDDTKGPGEDFLPLYSQTRASISTAKEIHFTSQTLNESSRRGRD